MNKEEFIKECNARTGKVFDTSLWDNVLARSFERDGDRIKLQIAQEELAELIQAISKYIREVPDARILVLEESADVIICIQNLKRVFNFTDEEIQTAIDVKVYREKKRLEILDRMDEFYGVGY